MINQSFSSSLSLSSSSLASSLLSLLKSHISNNFSQNELKSPSYKNYKSMLSENKLSHPDIFILAISSGMVYTFEDELDFFFLHVCMLLNNCLSLIMSHNTFFTCLFTFGESFKLTYFYNYFLKIQFDILCHDFYYPIGKF